MLADGAPLGLGPQAPTGSALLRGQHRAGNELDTLAQMDWLRSAALDMSHERLRRGRWVSWIRVFDDAAARHLTRRLRAAGHAAVLGPPDAAHAVGWMNRNRAVRVSDDLAVCFPWADCDAPAVVEIDPGQSFGAGAHPSTRLLASWLAEHIAGGERVLDVGSGSGVLALVAARLGVAEAVGIDIEASAVSSAKANATRNNLDGVASFSTTPVGTTQLGSFDVVVANITADVLLAHATDIADRVSPNGHLAVSGISAAQASTVAAAFTRCGIHLGDSVRLDDWVSLAGSRVQPRAHHA